MIKLLFRYKWLLLCVLIAAGLRLWQLGVVPASVDWDEAALGYNAYSILRTGKDEYGTAFPLVLRSFDDYKPPLYVYLTIPSVALFGLSPWSVRLPSAAMGILAVVGIYFLAEELIKDSKQKRALLSYMPLFSSFLLSISPWHIQFSRIAFEANSGVTLNIWAVYLFIKGLRSRVWLWVSACIFGLGLYAYHSERIFLPLLVLILLWNYRRELAAQKKNLMVFIVIGIATVLPLIPVVFNKTSVTRLQGTSALADQTRLLMRSVKKLELDRANSDVIGIILDNRRIEWVKTLFAGYLSHYSFKWLFLTGDNPRHHAPDMGLLYIWELPFLLWGIYSTIRAGGSLRNILIGWFLIAPIAASPTTELPHAIRTLVFLPTFQMFTAVGITEMMKWSKKYKLLLQKGIFAAIAVVVLCNIVYYLHMYFIHMDHEVSEYWQYGYRESVSYANSHKAQYKKIVVSTKLEQPHMFFLFYLKYDPALYLKEGGTSSGGFAEVRNKFDIYEFRPIRWDTELRDGSILYIGSPSEIPTTSLKTIYYLDGKEAMMIADH